MTTTDTLHVVVVLLCNTNTYYYARMHNGRCIYDMRVPLLRNVLRNAYRVPWVHRDGTMVYPTTVSLVVI